MAGTDTTVSRAERTLLDTLNAMDGEAEAAKKDVQKRWTENLKLARGEGQWKASRQPLFLMNMIRRQCQRKVAQLTESKPTFSVVSRLKHLMTASKVLNETCKAILESQEFYLTVERLARFGYHMGNGFLYTAYDPTLDFGQGDVGIYTLDPRYVYLDPAATEAAHLQRQASYVRWDVVTTLAQVRRDYPGRGALVTPDERYSEYEEIKGMGSTGVVSAALNLLPRPFRPRAASKRGPIDRVVLKTYWYQDPDRETWPGGREIIRAGDIILKDRPNKYWDQLLPIDMVDWDMDLDHPWGHDDVQDVKKLQEALNRLGDAIMRNALFNSQAWVIADVDALDAETWNKVTTEGGLIVKKRPTREFKRESPPQLPGYLFQMLTSIPAMADATVGIIEEQAKKGAKGADGVVEGLQATGSIVARMIARRFESLVQRVGQKLISRIVQYYSEDKMMQYFDPSRELVDYAFERQKLMTDDKGDPIRADELRTHFRKFNFLVTPYSSMPMSKMASAPGGAGAVAGDAGKGVSNSPCYRVCGCGQSGGFYGGGQEGTGFRGGSDASRADQEVAMPDYQVNLPPEGLDRLLDSEALAGRRFGMNSRIIRELLQQVQKQTPLLEGAESLDAKDMLRQILAKAPVGSAAAAAGSPLLGMLGMLAALLSAGGSADPEITKRQDCCLPQKSKPMHVPPGAPSVGALRYAAHSAAARAPLRTSGRCGGYGEGGE